MGTDPFPTSPGASGRLLAPDSPDGRAVDVGPLPSAVATLERPFLSPGGAVAVEVGERAAVRPNASDVGAVAPRVTPDAGRHLRRHLVLRR